MIDLKNLRDDMEFRAFNDVTSCELSPVQILELLDQLEAAQKDAARYQWLRDNGIEKSFKLVQTAGVLMTVHSDATLDSAIDAAMASKA